MEGAKSSIGLGIDASGGPVIDPTANVLSLVSAAVTRLDDMRLAESKRLSDLQVAEVRRIDDIAKIRAEYEEKLTSAESKRIDAIRAVDVAAVATAHERAITQAQVLATQVSNSAETLRALVATTATGVAAQLAQLSESLTARIAVLEKSQYVGVGRGQVSDPMLTELVSEMKSLRESRATGSGIHTGAVSLWGYVAAAIGILFGLAGIGLTIVNLLRH